MTEDSKDDEEYDYMAEELKKLQTYHRFNSSQDLKEEADEVISELLRQATSGALSLKD